MNDENKEVVDENVVDQPQETNDDNTAQEDEGLEYTPKVVKHLDEEIVIDSPEKEKEFLNKGADYDRVREELDKIKSDKGLELLKSMANERGMEYEELINSMQQDTKKAKIKKFMEEYDISNEELGADLYEKMQEKEQKAEKYEEIKQKQVEQDETKKQMVDLVNYYEDLTGEELVPENIDPEVFDIAEKEGKTLIDAFNKNELKKKLKKEKVDVMNKENKEQNIGDVTKNTNTGNEVKRYNGYTVDELNKMSPQELAKTGLKTQELAEVLKNI